MPYYCVKLKKKDGCQICVNKLVSSQPIRGLPLLGACLTKQFTNSSQKGLLICASKLQVSQSFTSRVYKSTSQMILQLITSAFQCSYKCSICPRVILNSNIKIQTIAFKRLSQIMDKPLYFQTYLFVLAFLIDKLLTKHSKICFRPIF